MAISKYLANTQVSELIDISEGRILGTTNIHKFGRNPNVGGAPETIWEQGGVYTYLTVASTVYVYGADAQDGADGTGARTVTVQGLDANYNEIEETLTVDGAVSTQSFLRVYRHLLLLLVHYKRIKVMC